jgi:hypothetical protein
MRQVHPREVMELGRKFESRGTSVRPPADDRALHRLENAIQGPLAHEARAILSIFDGFDEQTPDEATMVCLWSAEMIAQHAEAEEIDPRGPVIGDYFLSADLFRCDLRRSDSAVWWHDRAKVAAPTLYDFYKCVAEGLFKP